MSSTETKAKTKEELLRENEELRKVLEELGWEDREQNLRRLKTQ